MDMQLSQRTICKLVLLAFLTFLTSAILVSCNSNTQSIGSDSSTEQRDCLPPLTLTDQTGREFSLASLKGKPVLFDFIYTTCPGPCLVMTARMRSIANELGASVGTKVWLVSVTVDPEHDGPAALKAYAKEQGAEREGWYFLTGAPPTIDELMDQFKLKRKREPDGTVDHVLEFFLIGPNGNPLMQYLASDTNPMKIAADVQQVIDGGRLALERDRPQKRRTALAALDNRLA
jgi:protein SCO1